MKLLGFELTVSFHCLVQLCCSTKQQCLPDGVEESRGKQALHCPLLQLPYLRVYNMCWADVSVWVCLIRFAWGFPFPPSCLPVVELRVTTPWSVLTLHIFLEYFSVLRSSRGPDPLTAYLGTPLNWVTFLTFFVWRHTDIFVYTFFYKLTSFQYRPSFTVLKFFNTFIN